MSQSIVNQLIEDNKINKKYVQSKCGKLFEELPTEGIDKTNLIWKVNTLCIECNVPYFCHPAKEPHKSCNAKLNINGTFPTRSLTADGNCAECLSYNVVCKPIDHLFKQNSKTVCIITVFDLENAEEILIPLFIPQLESNYEKFYQLFLKILKRKLRNKLTQAN